MVAVGLILVMWVRVWLSGGVGDLGLSALAGSVGWLEKNCVGSGTMVEYLGSKRVDLGHPGAS